MSTTSISKALPKWIAAVCGTITVAVGIGILSSWVLAQRELFGLSVGNLPAARKAGLLFTLLGFALGLMCFKPASRMVRGCVAAIAIFCGVVAIITLNSPNYLTSPNPVNFAGMIDNYLHSVGIPIMPRRALTGYLAPTTAFTFILPSLSTFLLVSQARTLASILGSITALIGWVHLLGYVHGVPLMHKVDGPLMSFTASAAFVVLGTGLAAVAGPCAWPLRSFLGDSTRARLLRWLLPLILLLMFAKDWIANILLNKPASREIIVSTAIDLLALLIVALVILQISRLLGGVIDQAQATTKESEARFRTLTESSLVGVCVFQDGLFKYVNPALAQMVGYGPEELLTMKAIQLVHPEDQSIAAEMIRRRIDGEVETAHYTCRLLCKSGTLIEVEVLGRRILHEGRPAILSTVQDITERKRAEESLRRSRKDHARLSRDRENMLEQERIRISRHLHDELGQHLTYLVLQLSHMEKRLQGNDPALVQEMKETSQQAQAMIANVRSIAKSLRPIAIEHDGLIPSLHSAAAEFQRISGTKCRLIAELKDAIVEEPLATTIYRIVQEALTNVARHARACECEVRLTASDGQLDLSIHDDGKGSTAAALGGHRSLGIIGMKERAAAIGGTLSVKNDVKAGVLVSARFPLMCNSASDDSE